MASLTVSGLEDLISDMEAAANIPDSVAKEMLIKEAGIVEKAHKESIQSKGLIDSGQLIGSIEADKAPTGRIIEVYPRGIRKNGVRNAEVGFIHEYGAPGRHIPAKNWMKAANEGCADKATDAAFEVYDKFLKSKNL